MGRDIVITKHGYKRAKERLGWNKSAASRMAQKAWDEGLQHTRARGKVKKYIDRLYLDFHKRHGRSGGIVRIHGEVVYFFKGENLITLYRIDRKVIKHMKYN